VPDNPRDSGVERRLETWAASQPGFDLHPEIRGRVLAGIASSLTPVQPLPSQGRLVLAFLGVFTAGAGGLIAILDKAGFRLMTGLQMAILTAILAGAGTLFSLILVWRMVPGSRWVLRFPLVLTLCGLALFAGFALLFPWRTPRAFVSGGWPCAVLELMIAVPAAIIYWVLARRGALFVSAGLGATLTSLAVFLALIPLQFQCMFQQAPHLLVWHLGMAILLIGLGTLIGELGRRWWRP
jgi:hypothetical protein